MGACGSKSAGQGEQPTQKKADKQASLKQKKEDAPAAEAAPAAEGGEVRSLLGATSPRLPSTRHAPVVALTMGPAVPRVAPRLPGRPHPGTCRGPARSWTRGPDSPAPPVSFPQMTEEQAAVKIQAIQRGRKDRQKVEEMKAEAAASAEEAPAAAEEAPAAAEEAAAAAAEEAPAVAEEAAAAPAEEAAPAE